MSTESITFSTEGVRPYRAILWGGLSAGFLDITAACINSAFRGRSPMWVLQSVASGLLGAESFKGGLRAATLGAVLHFFIAFVACAVYFAASRRLGFMVQHAVVCGLLYGIIVYLFMYLVVLPLVFTGKMSYPFAVVVTALFIHMLCVGLPISLAVRQFSK